MKHTAIRRDNNETVRAEARPAESEIKYQWLPRIKCQDCAGKVYTAGPDNAIENFEVHLKNRGHKDKVEARIKKAGASQ